MTSLKILSTAAILALVIPSIPTSVFAQEKSSIGGGGGGGGGGARMGGGGGGGGGARMGGGGGGPRMGAGGGGGGPRMGVGGGGGGPRFNGGGGGPRFSGGGGGPRYGGGGYRRGGAGFLPGAVAGAVIGGAIASGGYYGSNGYYGGSPYYGSSYDDDIIDVSPGGGDDVAYCIQTYRSYDPRSGTYLGNDGLRHPCP